MRILAIRGCNLASLAGEFEIDLSRPPFGAAGVFAIVGNTGAGKSTLLDALCVALFDRTPRLTNHSRVVVGRGDDDPSALGAQDVRTLLRRGAAQGWAEVDFESGDARRYRARWSVRRARGQADAKVQDQQVTLVAIASPGFAGARSIAEGDAKSIDGGGERLGGTKTETLRAIVARLGLSFDQFRRSALLAQGEFAAFLRADGRDRSELLERMTGTEIYSRLSVAAHVKASIAEQALRDGRAVALAIAVLDDGAREAAEAELRIAEAARSAARARYAAADALARWQAEAARRDEALADAQAEHGRARGAAGAADGERAELALRRRAEQLRPAWEDAARIENRLSTVRGEAAAAGQALQRAIDAHEAIAGRRGEVVALLEPVRAGRIAAGMVERAGGAERSARPEDVALARAAADDAAWIVERAALAVEIAGWSEVDGRFAQHAALGDAIAGLESALRDQSDMHGKLRRARERVAAEQQAAIGKLTEAQRKADAFHKRRGVTLDAARKQEDEARTWQTAIDRLVAIAAGARATANARDEIERQRAELDDAARADAESRARVAAAQAEAVIVRGERARVLDELRRAAGYEHARAELRDGEECPLCGSTQHPWRDRGAFDEVIRDAEARLAEVSARLDASAVALAALAGREQHRAHERERLARHGATLIATAETAVTTWRDKLAALGELLLVADPASAAAAALAADREATAKKRLEEARTIRAQTEAATKAAQEAHAEMLLCQSNVDQLQSVIADHDRRIAELAASIERQEGERASRLERRAELAAELAATIRRWRAALPAPEAATARGRRRRTDTLALPDELASARAALGEVAAGWRVRAERVAAAEAATAGALAAIDREARDAERAVAEETARHVDCTRRADAMRGELAEAAGLLEAARIAASFERDELRRLLTAEPARVDALAARLATIERAVEHARAVVSERQRLVADHAAHRPAWSGDGFDSLDGLAAAVARADEHAARLVAALAADADARTRRDAALAALATTEAAAEADRILGEVIGSHDGKLFRSFAQSLTLDSLLAVANAHLEELAPRYQLERVPRHDLELQVIDRDLGSEVRSVQSLSGGESFLVSLALALGLSSMSAHDVRVRTLLIDEGFGTLDPATLDSALSVLDALQATGRQVGVISHVPALVERVGAHVRVIQRGGGRSEVVVA